MDKNIFSSDKCQAFAGELRTISEIFPYFERMRLQFYFSSFCTAGNKDIVLDYIWMTTAIRTKKILEFRNHFFQNLTDTCPKYYKCLLKRVTQHTRNFETVTDTTIYMVPEIMSILFILILRQFEIILEKEFRSLYFHHQISVCHFTPLMVIVCWLIRACHSLSDRRHEWGTP